MTVVSKVRKMLSPRRFAEAAAKRPGAVDASELGRANWDRSLQDPLGFYLRCYRYFHHHQAPDAVRKHREYFAKESRGFGEDAFHVMWYLLYREFRFKRFLEIGIYRGQTISLVSLLMQQGDGGEVVGISPFAPAADSVSRYMTDIDYEADTRANFEAFDLPTPKFLKAYSTDDAAVDLIRSTAWDCAYIDGNHDYEVAIVDWRNCADAVAPGGIVVLDDSGLSTRYRSPRFATKGHPGPSRVAEEIDRSEFTEILQVGHNRAFQKRPMGLR